MKKQWQTRRAEVSYDGFKLTIITYDEGEFWNWVITHHKTRLSMSGETKKDMLAEEAVEKLKGLL